MIEVKLYQNYSDPYKVHKNISLIATVQCEITEEQDIDSLELLLDMQNIHLLIHNCLFLDNVHLHLKFLKHNL